MAAIFDPSSVATSALLPNGPGLGLEMGNSQVIRVSQVSLGLAHIGLVVM